MSVMIGLTPAGHLNDGNLIHESQSVIVSYHMTWKEVRDQKQDTLFRDILVRYM